MTVIKKKTIVFWLFLFSLSSNLFAQVTTFSKRYDMFENPQTGGGVLPLDTGYLLIGTTDDTSLTQKQGIVIKGLDLNGNELWAKFYAKTNGSFIVSDFSTKKDINGDYYMTGSYEDTAYQWDVMIYRFKPNGDTIWTREIDNSESGMNIVKAGDGGYAVLSTKYFEASNNRQIQLHKTDSDGNEIWRKTFGGGNTEVATSLLALADGYLITGYTQSFGLVESDVYVINTDLNGIVQWDTTYGGTLSENGGITIKTSDSNYLIATSQTKYILSSNYPQDRPHFYKIDPDKNLIWEKEYGPARFITGVLGLYEETDGDMVIGGTRTERNGTPYGNGWPVAWFMKLNADGDSLWYRTYKYFSTQKSHHYLSDFRATPDGGMVGSGYIRPSAGEGDTGTQDFWVIKLDEWGCLQEGCEVGVQEISQEGASLKVYPNPISDFATIEVEVQNDGNLILYDALGKEHMRTTIEKGVTFLHLPAQELSPGIWFCTLELNNGNRVTQKIIKE